jgi:methionyl-tRNA formyltransferase
MGVDELALLHETCERSGHVPIAYTFSRSMRPGQPADPYTVRKIGEAIASSPPDVDLLLPAGPAGLGRALVGYHPDLLVVYGFNWILPPDVFGMPRLGTINIHPSLLPRYRGPAPVLWAIRNGDAEIGVTIHRIDEGVDTGPILAQRAGIPLDDDVTRDRLAARLAPAIRDLLTTALVRVVERDPGQPQPEPTTSYAGFLEPQFSQVDWMRTRWEIHHQVRVFRYLASSDAPVARVGGRWVRLVRTSLAPAGGVPVECADGPLWIVESEPAVPPVRDPPPVAG